jgi:hypothetical protein
MQLSRKAQFVVFALSAGYLSALFVLGLREAGQFDLRQYIPSIELGIVVYPASLFSQAAAWALLVGFLRSKSIALDWSDIRIYASSYLLRRMPGGVWQVVGRIAAYRDLGVGAATPVIGSALEFGLVVGVAGAAYCCFALISGLGLVQRLVLVVTIVGLLGGITGWFVVRSQRGQRRAANVVASVVVHVTVSVVYLWALVVASVILDAFVRSTGRSGLSMTDVIGVWSLVALVGTIAGLLPATLGLREVTLAILLSSHLGASVAVVIALLFRLLFIAGDLLWSALLVFIATTRRPLGSVSR